MRGILKFAAIGVAVFAALRLFGLTPERVVADARDLVSGNYLERTKQQLRSEAAKVPVAGESEKVNDELNRELLAERKRIMEEKANTLEKLGSQVVKGDIESLKKQAEENARQAGGGQ